MPITARLRKAAAIVREKGLAKGCSSDIAGRVCANEALSLASAGPFHQAVREFLGEPLIADWNDRPERTAEDVAATFEAVADALDAAAAGAVG